MSKPWARKHSSFAAGSITWGAEIPSTFSAREPHTSGGKKENHPAMGAGGKSMWDGERSECCSFQGIPASTCMSFVFFYCPSSASGCIVLQSLIPPLGRDILLCLGMRCCSQIDGGSATRDGMGALLTVAGCIRPMLIPQPYFPPSVEKQITVLNLLFQPPDHTGAQVQVRVLLIRCHLPMVEQ